MAKWPRVSVREASAWGFFYSPCHGHPSLLGIGQLSGKGHPEYEAGQADTNKGAAATLCSMRESKEWSRLGCISTLYMFLTRVMAVLSKGRMGTAPRGPHQRQGGVCAVKQSPPRDRKDKGGRLGRLTGTFANIQLHGDLGPVNCQNLAQQWVLSMLTPSHAEGATQVSAEQQTPAKLGVPTMTPSWARAAHLPGPGPPDIFKA